MMLSTHRDRHFRQLSQRFRSCRGMTLVELMVVTAIFGVVIGAIYSLVLPVQKSTFTQTKVVDMQDSLRLALDQITQDVRHAGLLVEGDPVANDTAREFTIRLMTPPQALGSRIVNYAYTPPPVTWDSNTDWASLLGGILTPTGVTYRFDPPLMTGRFRHGMLVRILDVVEKRVLHTDVSVLINDVAGNDPNVNDPTRFNDDTITFNLTPEELEALRPEDRVLYVMPMTVGTPAVRTITYIFDPNDNTLPGGARPTLRRYEDWPVDDGDPATPLPPIHPIPAGTPNWLLLGGDAPIAGDNFRRTFDAQFDFDPDTDQFTIDITGRTEAYDRNNLTNDALSNAKNRRLRTTVSLRNSIPTY